MSNKPEWIESEFYGNECDGQFKVFCNYSEIGWDVAKEKGEDYSGLGFQYMHSDGEGGSTYITLEEAKDLHAKIGEYIKFMSDEYPIKLKDVNKYKQVKAINSHDVHNSSVILLAESWAKLMESALMTNYKLKDVALDSFLVANGSKVGVKGFHLVYATAFLIDVWEHGDELKEWYKEYQDQE